MPGISSVLPLRSIFWQKCHQRLFRQRSRHGFRQRLFQKLRSAQLGRARPMLCYTMPCCTGQNAIHCLRMGAPLPVIICATSQCRPSSATCVRHQIYGKILALFQSGAFPIFPAMYPASPQKCSLFALQRDSCLETLTHKQPLIEVLGSVLPVLIDCPILIVL